MRRSTSLLIPALWLAASAGAQSIELRMAPEVGLESRYHTRLQIYIEAEMMPFPPDQPFMTQDYYYSQSIGAAEGDNRQVTAVVDSVRVQELMPTGTSPDSLVGESNTFVVSPTGEIVSAGPNATEEDLAAARALGEGIMGVVKLPNRVVSLGDTWESDSELDLDAGGQAMKMIAHTTYLLEGVREVDGHQHAFISFTGTIDGDGGDTGLIEGMEGETTGTLVFDATDSRIIEQSAERIMNMMAQGQTVTMRMKTTRELLP